MMPSHATGNREYNIFDTRSISSSSTISSTATADDLPGAGYLVGLFYKWAGRHLEIQLGRIAETMGKGPRVTAQRIWRRRTKVDLLPLNDAKMEAKQERIKKDCKALVSYARSSIVSTRLDALERIAWLAFEYSDVRETFLDLGAERAAKLEPIEEWDRTWIDYYPLLTARSRRALVTLKDVELHDCFGRMRVAFPSPGNRRYTSVTINDEDLHDFMIYLNKPDTAFFIIRYLEQWFSKADRRIWNRSRMQVVTYIGDIRVLSSTEVEWTVLDKLITSFFKIFSLWKNKCDLYCGTLPRLFELVIRFADKLPQTTCTEFFSWFAAFIPLTGSFGEAERSHARLSLLLLDRLNGKDGLFANRGDQDGFSPFHHRARALLRRLSCHSEILACKLVGAMSKDWYDTSGYHHEDQDVIGNQLRLLCELLAVHIDSEDKLNRIRALEAFRYLLSRDIYCRPEALRALSMTDYAQSTEYRILIAETAKKCVAAKEVDRHDVIKVAFWDFVQRFSLERGDFLQFRVHRGQGFSAAGLFPLVVGRMWVDRLAYLTQMETVKRCGKFVPERKSTQYVAIVEGTRPEYLRFSNVDGVYEENIGKPPEELYVFVLRYTPESYISRRRDWRFDWVTGLDPCGVYFGKPRVGTIPRVGETFVTDWDSNVGSEPPSAMSDDEDDGPTDASSIGGRLRDDEGDQGSEGWDLYVDDDDD